MKHNFEPTDNQGHSMECIHCGEFIAIGNSDWKEKQEEDCKKVK